MTDTRKAELLALVWAIVLGTLLTLVLMKVAGDLG
jgi:cytochrome c oxidase subunit IV